MAEEHVQAKLDELEAHARTVLNSYVCAPLTAQTCNAIRDALAAFLPLDYCVSVVPDPRDGNSVLVNVSPPPGMVEINLVI